MTTFLDKVSGTTCLLVVGMGSTASGQTDLIGTLRHESYLNFGAIFRLNENGAQVVHEFKRDYWGQSSYPEEFVLVGSGELFGVTHNQSSTYFPAIVSFSPIPGEYQERMIFPNDGSSGEGLVPALIEGPDGTLLGVCTSGGQYEMGTLFRFEPATNSLSVLHHFVDTQGSGPWGALLLHPDGSVYGTTRVGGSAGSGVLFRLDPTTLDYQVLHEFDMTGGANPVSRLTIGPDGALWGMVSLGGPSGSGGIFRYSIEEDSYVLRYEFSEETGTGPAGDLVLGQDGRLYGALSGSAENDHGVFFRYDASTDNFDVVLEPGSALGVASGTPTLLPNGNLLFFTGTGADESEWWFMPSCIEYDPVADQVVWGPESSWLPPGRMILASDQRYYFMSTSLVMAYDHDAHAFSPKHDLRRASLGEDCNSLLLKLANGKLAGTTRYGGRSDDGVLYTYDPIALEYDTLCSLDSARTLRGVLSSDLVESLDGDIYFISPQGSGNLLHYEHVTEQLHTDLDFDTLPCNGPTPTLTLMPSGHIMGACWYGGDFDAGVLWEFVPSTGQFIQRHSFSISEPVYSSAPYGRLVVMPDGDLIGVTGRDAAYGNGMIYRYSPADSTVTELYSFQDDDLRSSVLMLLPDGLLVGAGGGGCFDDGGIYTFDPVSLTHNEEYCFDNILGSGLPTVMADGVVIGFSYCGYYRWSQQNGYEFMGSMDEACGFPLGGLVEVEMLHIGSQEETRTERPGCFPNPATDVLNINVADVENASVLEVIDASGRLVLSQGIGNNATLATLDVSGLNNGVYSVRARGTNSVGGARVFEVVR